MQTHTKRYYASTHIEQKRHASHSGGEEASAEHQNKVRQSLVIHSKTHQATSGIMRELALMCARRKERSDGIAHCYGKAVNRVECPLCRANEGKHVRKGWLFTYYVCTHSISLEKWDISFTTMKNMIIEMYNEASADTDDRSVLVVREGGMSMLNKIRRSIACFSSTCGRGDY